MCTRWPASRISSRIWLWEHLNGEKNSSYVAGRTRSFPITISKVSAISGNLKKFRNLKTFSSTKNKFRKVGWWKYFPEIFRDGKFWKIFNWNPTFPDFSIFENFQLKSNFFRFFDFPIFRKSCFFIDFLLFFKNKFKQKNICSRL